MNGVITDLIQTFGTVLAKGGWVPILLALLWVIYKLYMFHIQEKWYETQNFVFLKISAPQENLRSPLAFEQIFAHLHSLETSRSWAETHLEGEFQLWFTWEITSIGGDIGNYVRIREKDRDTLEAAIYAQFPEAEIEEAVDYFEHLPPYDPETSDYDIFAFSNKLIKEDAYPIRTFVDFEHASADTIVDPATSLWEALNKVNEYEMVVVQYLFKPVKDDWKEEAKKLIKDLKGEPKAEGKDLFTPALGRVMDPILNTLTRAPAPEGGSQNRQNDDKEPPSLMLHKTEREKGVIEAIERNISKWGYETKIRCLYVAPKEKYNYGHVTAAVIGSFKSLSAYDLNAIKPDTDTWTKVFYWFFKDWEKSIVKFRLNFRKKKFMWMMRNRSFDPGYPPFVLNTEEMATLIHFPQTDVTVPRIQRVPVTKEQAPAELPISEEL